MSIKIEKNIETLFNVLSENNKKEDIVNYYINQRQKYGEFSNLARETYAINNTVMEFLPPIIKKCIDSWDEVTPESEILPSKFYLKRFKERSRNREEVDIIENALVDMVLKYKIYGKK